MYKLKVLIVDDDPDILELLESTLESEFRVVKAATGEQALTKIKEERPGLLVLDYMLPDSQGTAICALLRKDPLFLHLPILMLTGKGEVESKVTGLEAGADDYMVKPFSPQELLARIRMLIRRSNIHLDANPLTRLPGNVSITKELEAKISSKEKTAVLYIDIDNFKALNDYYGFKRGDEVIKETARILIDCVQEKGTVTDFIGHIGGDDFVIITSPKTAENIAKSTISKFDKVSPKFFDEKDRIKGYIETKNRESNLHKFKFLTLSIGIITNLYREFTHTAQISSLGAEIKGFAKKFPESKYLFDKRIPEDF
ncbi:MAG: response regulator [Candidatus Omnitrophota bacterium]|nr:MAG: response regulator [Candidatus Omnitrophota bacterium]